MMDWAFKQEFFAFVLEHGVLRFGEFTLKSGRQSPYFFDTSRLHGGGKLRRLAGFYARLALLLAPETQVVCGPAYKGIPLCIALAMALEEATGTEVGYLFDRKEAKTHGDGGRFVGKIPEAGERMLLVDDVMTDGGTKHALVELLSRSFAARHLGFLVALDRREKDREGRLASGNFTRKTGIPVHALLSFADFPRLLGPYPDLAARWTPALENYQKAHGASEAS